MWLLGWLTFVTLNQEPHNPIGGASLLRFNEKAQCLGPAYSRPLSVHISLGCSNALKEEHRYTHAHTLESMLLLIVCSNICSGYSDVLKEHCFTLVDTLESRYTMFLFGHIFSGCLDALSESLKSILLAHISSYQFNFQMCTRLT